LTNVTGRFRSKRDILRKGGGSSSSNHSYSGQKEEKPLLMTPPVPVILFILKETVLAVPERQRKTLGKGKIRRGVRCRPVYRDIDLLVDGTEGVTAHTPSRTSKPAS
jgi:hypothetical protein